MKSHAARKPGRVTIAFLIVTDHTSYDYARIVEEAQLVVDSRNATRRVWFPRRNIALLNSFDRPRPSAPQPRLQPPFRVQRTLLLAAQIEVSHHLREGFPSPVVAIRILLGRSRSS